MRNHPSDQSRSSRYSNYVRPNTQPTEIRYITRQLSDENKGNTSRTNRRSETTSNNYEYVPQNKSSQKRYSPCSNNYEKPSLPYYVVPVLYVPQKVLSSQDIRRPSSPVQKLEEEPAPFDVDAIPCISCETKKKLLHKRSYYIEDTTASDNDLKEGYVNADYCKSSTSGIDDLESDEEPQIFEKPQRIYQRPPEIPYLNYDIRSNRRCHPRVYKDFLEKQRRFASCKCKPSQKPIAQMQWNYDCQCYEPVNYQCTRLQCLARNREPPPAPIAPLPPPPPPPPIPPAPLTSTASTNTYKPCKDNYGKHIKVCDDRHYCFESEPCEDSSHEDTDSQSPIDLQNYSSFNPCNDMPKLSDHSQNQCPTAGYKRESTLSCRKAPNHIKKIEPYLGVSMEIDTESTSCRKAKMKVEESMEFLSAAPIEKALEDTHLLSVKPPSRNKVRRTPKESQTNFDETVNIMYNRRCEDDDSCHRDSDRSMRMFATCPPPYIQQIREEVNLTMKQKHRDSSPSPTRMKRPQSPIKQYAGDTANIANTSRKQLSKNTSESLQKSTFSSTPASYLSKFTKNNKKRKPRPPLATA